MFIELFLVKAFYELSNWERCNIKNLKYSTRLNLCTNPTGLLGFLLNSLQIHSEVFLFGFYQHFFPPTSFFFLNNSSQIELLISFFSPLSASQLHLLTYRSASHCLPFKYVSNKYRWSPTKRAARWSRRLSDDTSGWEKKEVKQKRRLWAICLSIHSSLQISVKTRIF